MTVRDSIDSVRYNPDTTGMTGRQRLAAYSDARVNLAADLAAEYGLTNHPKAGRLFELAWQQGHSEGLYAVLDWYGELSELLI